MRLGPLVVAVGAAALLTSARPPLALAVNRCPALLNEVGSTSQGAADMFDSFGPRTSCNDVDTQSPSSVSGVLEKPFGSRPLKRYTTYVGDSSASTNLLRDPTAGLFIGAPSVPVDKRLSVTGKPGFPLSFRDFVRRHTGVFDAGVTFALGDEGLVDGGLAGTFGATGGVFRLDRPPFVEGGPPSFSTFLEATYFAAQNGFRVVAFDTANVVLGAPVLIPSSDEVDLRIQQTDTTLTLYARATPADRTSDAGWLTLSSQSIPVPATPFSFGLAAEGLDHGATAFFDFFTLSGPDVGGATERPLMNQLGGLVFDPLGDAYAALQDASPNLPAVSASLQSAATGATTVAAAVQAALDAATFQAAPAGKAALGFAKKAGKAALAAKKIADKGDPTKASKILKKVLDGARAVIVAVSNLAGFKAHSLKDVPFSFANP